MDKMVGKMVKESMGKGEKQAPVKSIKVKVKFRKPTKHALKNAAAKKLGDNY